MILSRSLLRLLAGIGLGILSVRAQTGASPLLYLLRLDVTGAKGAKLSGADVRLDGAIIGVTDSDGEYCLARKPMPAAPHTLSVSLPGFETYSRDVTLPAEPDPGIRVHVRLNRAKPAAVTVLRGEMAPEPNRHVVRIFYVTDRRETSSADATQRFANERALKGAISRGTAEISIPREHRAGELEAPSWLHLEYRFDPARHVVLTGVAPLSAADFYRKLNDRVEQARGKEAVVFVHGYNNSFEESARRLAQLTYDLQFDGAPILYSWPSKARVLGYTADEDTVQWTAFHLRDFLEELAQSTGATRIHLIAHSMGNRALTSALQVIAARREKAPKPLFHQVVLAAPDIGADTLDLLSREIRPLADRITLYASANDDALIFSRLVHSVTRAGGAKGNRLLIAPGIDTVDASNAQTDFLGHNYVANSASIITDIHKILATGASPDLRNLVPAVLENLKYWIIPAAVAH